MENDNIADKLSKILDDPSGMEKLQAMAQSLFGQEQASAPNDNGSVPNAGEMDMMMKAVSMLKNDKGDDRSRLLLALKPHLSPDRCDRVDKAVKLLKVANLLPLLGEFDLFKL